MRKPRIYQALQTTAGEEITLSDEAVKHLIQVLRLREGDPFILFNGHNQSWEARLVSLTKKQATAKIDGELSENLESPLQIHLGLGISKGERMDYAIQKSVELGVTEITPVFTRYSMVKLDDKRREKRQQHWQGIITGACEQCGRNQLPALHPITDSQTWLTTINADLKLTLDPLSRQSLKSIQATPTSIALYIGPEGGLTEDEIQKAHSHGFEGMQLGPRILRTETAAVATITAIQMWWGDLA